MRFILYLLVALGFVSAPFAADTYPNRPIRVIVPFAAGGSADVFARAVGQKLSDAWGQQIVVDNRPGSGADRHGNGRRRAARRLHADDG